MGNKCMRAPDLEHNQPKVQSKPAIDKNYLQVNTTPDEVALYTEKKEDEKKENENSKSPVKGEVSAEQIVEDAEERKHESANFKEQIELLNDRKNHDSMFMVD